MAAGWLIDELSPRVDDLKKKAMDAYAAYQAWGEKNRQQLEKIPGMGPILRASDRIAETPGMDYMFPMTGFTAPSFTKELGDIIKTGPKAIERQLPKIFEKARAIYVPSQMSTEEFTHVWPHSRLAQWPGLPTVGEASSLAGVDPVDISQMTDELYKALKNIHPALMDPMGGPLPMVTRQGSALRYLIKRRPPPKSDIIELIQAGPIGAYLDMTKSPANTVFGSTHEIGHGASLRTAMSDYVDWLRGITNNPSYYSSQNWQGLSEASKAAHKLGVSAQQPFTTFAQNLKTALPDVQYLENIPRRARYHQYMFKHPFDELFADSFAARAMLGQDAYDILPPNTRDLIEQFFIQ